MNRKKIVASILTTSLLVTSLVGCVSSNNKTNTNNNSKVQESVESQSDFNELRTYVGKSYNEVSEKNGTGSEKIEEVEGKKVIVSSSYSIRMFNYNANLILELDDSKNVSAVSVHFKGIGPENILENIKKVLGEPKVSKDKENGDSKVYSWEKDGYQYKLSEVGEETIITVNKNAI
ncbi:hypothetical protein P5F04_11310 [Clostridium perfringens]|uniref:Lipoprotein n=1 Tax=Clostridium perfringens TaxID=1502 RepID=A0A133MS02_CLOPF|nr:hypothetical protein [Clostridium perfringens]EGT3601464.1 hypothetical protein [Clostridium perfringens]KXA06822.1 hypothetical protein HMPREF3222_02852 [Clostridium perfringens]MBS5920257.1 hypothetical protein [Clostridium perfringens]MDK0566092.1 hypothetical protein [Clostridium perfringens]MDK0571508.1 hypothetical protein [Clostridium perfringens]